MQKLVNNSDHKNWLYPTSDYTQSFFSNVPRVQNMELNSCDPWKCIYRYICINTCIYIYIYTYIYLNKYSYIYKYTIIIIYTDQIKTA